MALQVQPQQNMGGIQGPQYPNTQTSNIGGSGSYLNRYTPPSLGGYTPSGGAYLPRSPTGGFVQPKTSYSYKQAYPAGVEQQAEDYDRIMHGYQSVFDQFAPGGADPFAPLRARLEGELDRGDLSYSPVTAAQQQYNRTGEMNTAFGTLGEYARTGGLSGDEISELRARGVSPVRAAYANAMREMNRNKSIQGGYSPNYNAALAKMTREQSDRMAGALTDVNAGIAEMRQKGRLAMAPQYANLAAGENELQANIGSRNTAALNEVALANAINKLRAQEASRSGRLGTLDALTRLTTSGQDQRLGALSGMTSLYGTTPALANTFGNQALSAAQLKEQARARKASSGANLVNSYVNAMRTPRFG